MPTSADFVIKTWVGLHGDQWVVVRLSDRRVMTMGTVLQCLDWVRIWAPVQGNKRGMELSSKAVL